LYGSKAKAKRSTTQMESMLEIDEMLKEKEKKEEEAKNKMKITNGIGNINIKNIWDIQHIKKLTDDLFDS
jgi:hypothetical protein|tara:strand:- start:309 stop:518 length:210 start_codon:yes stop_codon:yes gene_type:complete